MFAYFHCTACSGNESLAWSPYEDTEPICMCKWYNPSGVMRICLREGYNNKQWQRISKLNLLLSGHSLFCSGMLVSLCLLLSVLALVCHSLPFSGAHSVPFRTVFVHLALCIYMFLYLFYLTLLVAAYISFPISLLLWLFLPLWLRPSAQSSPGCKQINSSGIKTEIKTKVVCVCIWMAWEVIIELLRDEGIPWSLHLQTRL